MLEFHDIEQNCDDWLALRAGHLTASNMSKVMADYGKAFGKPAKQLAVTIAVEQITGKPQANGYSNAHMERGHEQEPLARLLYEQEYFSEVKNGGFFDAGFMGCSPDGLPDDGLIEIKSVIPHVHYASIKRQNVDPAYKWQCLSSLLITGKPWLDFVSYCADFPEGKQLFVYHMVAAEYGDELAMIRGRVIEFQLMVVNSKKLIDTSKYRV